VSRRIVVLAVVLIALSAGGAVAASRFLITSVNQISPTVRLELRGNRGPRGVTGRRGARGATGTPGPAGAAGITNEFEVTGTTAIISGPAPANTSQAICPGGDIVLSGGWKGLGADTSVSANEPTTVNGDQAWVVVAALNHTTDPEGSFQAVALCSGPTPAG
jgi:hypothetical protein